MTLNHFSLFGKIIIQCDYSETLLSLESIAEIEREKLPLSLSILTPERHKNGEEDSRGIVE